MKKATAALPHSWTTEEYARLKTAVEVTLASFFTLVDETAGDEMRAWMMVPGTLGLFVTPAECQAEYVALKIREQREQAKQHEEPRPALVPDLAAVVIELKSLRQDLKAVGEQLGKNATGTELYLQQLTECFGALLNELRRG